MSLKYKINVLSGVKITLVLIFFINCKFFGKCTILFDTLKNIIETQKGDISDELSKAALQSKIKDSIIKASELLDLENFESSDCEPDLSKFCPDKWTYLGDGVHCEADYEYNGSCNKVLDFSDKTPLEKLKLSRDCSFTWPCKRNETVKVPEKVIQCPKFWYSKDNICIPYDSYLGLCGELSLADLEKNKEELTLKCNLEWDNNLFKVGNLIDFSENCPLGYTGGEYCTPDENFNPKFQGPLHFKDLEDKLVKTELYNLSWNFKMRNEEYLDEICPYKWKFDPETNLCLADPEYEGPCLIRVDFSKYDKRVKNIWANVCLFDFYPDNQIKESADFSKEKIYKDGAVEGKFRILKRKRNNENDTPVEILQKQLNELYKLRKKSTDDHFLSTLEFTIDKLEKKIMAPSFLQISSQLPSKKYKCPYNWDEYENICVAPKTYQTFVPNCFTIISRFSQKSDESCRLQFNEDYKEDEDFVREPCPMGWKYERKLDGRMIRTICRSKLGKITHRFSQCGTKVDFTNVSPNFKRNWAFVCNVKFPSRSSKSEIKCKQNFYRKCPYGWREDEHGCVAPSFYFGPCDKLVKFSEIATPELKKSFSQKCLAFWDCLDNCEKNYSNSCPKGWSHSNGKCVATYKYDYPCKNEFSLPKIWNELSKQEFEFICQAYWPCKT